LSPAGLLATLGLALLLTLAGRRLSGVAGSASPVAGALAGFVGLHLLVTLLDAMGIRWSPALLLAPPALVLLLPRRFLPHPPRARGPSGPGWGDGLALFALAVFTLLALTGWTAIPDFIFHWGTKGHRFFVARGVDYAYLAQPWHWAIHPDYPNLLPELFAATSLLAGRFDVAGAMLWTGIFFTLLLAGVREALEQAASSRFYRQAGIALVALPAAAVGIGHLMAGAADWMIALALVAALPALLRLPDRAGDVEVGVAAAFAAASKIEGIPLAGFLVLVQIVRRLRADRRLELVAVLRLVLPPAAVGLPWLARVLHHGLLQTTNSGAFELSRAGLIGPALLEALASPAWHGFILAVFLPLPLLFRARIRPVAVVVALQLVFDLYVYFTAPVDTRFYVLSSFARLAFQVIPAILVVTVLALEPRSSGNEKPAEQPAGFSGRPGTGDQRRISAAAPPPAGW
jgi:hypothetical protein